MIKEACSILCKQCEDPLLGLLVARIVESQCLLKYGNTGRKGGYILGPVSRNIISTYVLPGFLSGVEIGSNSNLSTRYTEIFNLKGKIVLPTAQLRTSSAKKETEKDVCRGIPSIESNKCYQHREEKLKVSFGASGVDAAALSLVCAMWLQCNRTVDICFQHCCAKGFFSSALSAHSPLLPLHIYGTIQSFFSSTPPRSTDIFTPNNHGGATLSHPLSFPAGHVIAERVSNILSSASVIRWLLVSSGDDFNTGTKKGIVQDPSIFRTYRSKNLSFNSRQISSVFTAVEYFLAEALSGKKDLSALEMEVAALKSDIFKSFGREKLKSKVEVEEGSRQRERYENTFKKSCRAAFVSWKRDQEVIKNSAEREREATLFPPVDSVAARSAIVGPSTFDIFDMPSTRRVPSRLPPSSVITATAAATACSADPVSEDPSSVSLARFSGSLSGAAKGNAAHVDTLTAPTFVSATVLDGDISLNRSTASIDKSTGGGMSALDMFDPPSRPTRPRPVPVPVPPAAPAFDIFDMPTPPRKLRAPVQPTP